MINIKTTFIGPRLVSFFGKETIGGGTVLFENAILEIEKEHKIININGDSKWVFKKLLFNLILFSKYLLINPHHKILFVAHRQAIIFIIIDFFHRKNITYRLIGGNFDYWFKSPIVKYLLKKNSKNYTFYCELPMDVSFFKKFGINSYVQENFRCLNKSNIVFNSKKLNSVYITIGFIGRVTGEKGIFEFIELAKLSKSNNFIIAGPFENKEEKSSILKCIDQVENLSYIGIINSTKINEFFDQIDLLFFHSNHKGEGKPGVLIESLLSKTPVLTNYRVECSNWNYFYENNYITLTNDYEESLKNPELINNTFSDQKLELFSAKFCVNQILKNN